MKIEKMDGVTITTITEPKFKTNRLLIRLIEPVANHKLAERTLLANILETSTQKYPTQTDLAKQLEQLFGATLNVTVRREGNAHILSFSISFVDDQFVNQDLLNQVLDLMNEVIFHPLTGQHGFEQSVFELQRKNLVAYIQSVKDDKVSYALQQAQKTYFDSPDQKSPSYGFAEEYDGITNDSLYADYQSFIASDAVAIYYMSAHENDQAIDLIKTKLPFEKRTPQTFDYYYQQPKKAKAELTEKFDVAQSQLDLIYQTPFYYNDDYFYYAALVFNAVFGGSPSSKLFTQVREKASLAYFASSRLDLYRGTMSVQTGIAAQNKEQTLSLIMAQLDLIKNGDVSDEEMQHAKSLLINAKVASEDRPGTIIQQAYRKEYLHMNRSLDDFVSAIEQVSIDDLKECASAVELQTIYFLEGELNGD